MEKKKRQQDKKNTLHFQMLSRRQAEDFGVIESGGGGDCSEVGKLLNGEVDGIIS